MRKILHVDMDVFRIGEQRDHPEWRGVRDCRRETQPKSVVSTCSYEARVSYAFCDAYSQSHETKVHKPYSRPRISVI